MVKFAPSILAADFWRLGEQVKAAEEAGANRFHIDVMDGRFVPNLSLGIPIVEAMRRGTSLPLEMHLMIKSPSAMSKPSFRLAPTSSSSIKKPPHTCTGPSK
jgi:ribulose-phosphate 3-epimerase